MTPPCWIITAPRSGSNLLCELLNSTGLFSPPFAEHYTGNNYCLSLFEFPRFNKLMRFMFQGMDYAEVYQRLLRAHPNVRFVHLIRKDVVKQALSQYFSLKTGFWLVNERNLEQAQRVRVPYSFDRIQKQCWHLHEHENWAIDSVFLSESDRLFAVYYEDLVVDVQAQMDGVLEFLGAPGTYDWPTVYAEISKTKQIVTPNPRKQEYYDRFMQTLKCRETFRALPHDVSSFVHPSRIFDALQ